MRIFIEPTEPLLFRTGRPFQAGEHNFAETIFPPTPETLQGAIRAMIATQWGLAHADRRRTVDQLFTEPEVIKLIGKREESAQGASNVYGRFRITGSTLGRYDVQSKQVTRLFPAPAHILEATVAEADERERQVQVRMQPQAVANELSNHPAGTQLLCTPDLDTFTIIGKSGPLRGWLTSRGLSVVLGTNPLSTLQKEDLVANHQIYETESRLGIGIAQQTKTTREGYLYQTLMIRMQQHYGFVVDIELGEEKHGGSAYPVDERLSETTGQTASELAFLQKGWMTLGGEQRAARFRVLQASECADETGVSRLQPGHLLYFATPAYFSQGWIWDTRLFPTRPLSAVIQRYQSIGGWLLNPGNAGGKSKTTRRCIPAGSVYYFDKQTTISVDKPLTEYGWQIGYGITYTGAY